MRRALVSARDFWIDHLWLDLVIAAVLLALHYGAARIWPSIDFVGAASPEDRRSVYSATAIVVSLLGSFSAVAIGQLSAAKGERADALREAGGVDLGRNWRGIFRTAMLCALVAIAALLVDPSVPSAEVLPSAIRWIFEAVLLLAIVRFMRLSALFVEVLEVGSLGSAGKADLAPAPTPSPGWADRRRSASGS
jgi:uncharacterized membrane protein